MRYEDYKLNGLKDIEIAKIMIEEHNIPYHETAAGLFLKPPLVPGWFLSFENNGQFIGLFHENYRNLKQTLRHVANGYHRHDIKNYNTCDVILYIIGHDGTRKYKEGLSKEKKKPSKK